MPMVVIGGGRKRFEIVGVSDDDPYIHGFLDENRDSEPGLQRFCRTYLRDDMTVLDIGANVGVTPLILSEHFRRGHVHAVEPGNNTFDALVNNIKNNNVVNIDCYKYAISNKSEIVRFSDNSAWGGIAKGDNFSENVHELNALSLDDLVDQINISSLDFIKADIEGFEPLLFEGGSKTIEAFGPIIYFELNSWAMMVNGPFDPISFLEKVAEKYPFVYRVSDNPDAEELLQRIEGPPKWIAQQLVHDNVVHFHSVNDVVVSKRELQPIIDEYTSYKINQIEERIAILSSQLEVSQQEAINLAGERDKIQEMLSNANVHLTEMAEKCEALSDLSANYEKELLFYKVKVAAITGDWNKNNNNKILKNIDIIRNAFKTNLKDEDFVENLYKVFLGRESDGGGYDHHLSSIKSGASRMTVFLNVVDTEEFKEKHSGR